MVRLGPNDGNSNGKSHGDIDSDDKRTIAGSATTATAPACEPMRSLVFLAARAVAQSCSVQEIALHLDFLPTPVRRWLLSVLSDDKLRALEVQLQSQQPPDEWSCTSLEQETQVEWRKRFARASLQFHPASLGLTAKRVAVPFDKPATTTAHGSQQAQEQSVLPLKANPMDFRQIFWESRFRKVLQRQAAETSTSTHTSNSATACQVFPLAHYASDSSMPRSPRESVALYVDVIRVLKLRGREIVAQNVEMVRQLRCLERLEVHHPEQQRLCWESFVGILTNVQSLRQMGFFHGKLSQNHLEMVLDALLRRYELFGEAKAIETIELVSIRFRQDSFRQLVEFVHRYPHLKEFRITSSIADFENHLLLNALMRSPKLERLCLDHNDLEDQAFAGFSVARAFKKRIVWKRLEIGSNCVTATTLRGIAETMLAHKMELEELSLMNNTELGDPGIDGFAPVLRIASSSLDNSPTGVPIGGLRSLDLRNCGFTIDGARTLFSALETNNVLRHLDLGQNFFGQTFGDLLARFLQTNKSLTSLHLDYVGLGSNGVTSLLLQAIDENETLTSFALSANRLRDSGVNSLFRVLVKRCLRKPFVKVDLSGNLITSKAIQGMATVLLQSESDLQAQSARKRHEKEDEATRERRLKRRKLFFPELEQLHPQRNTSSPAGPVLNYPWIEELSLVDNDLKTDVTSDLQIIRRFVREVLTNEWNVQSCVYDDEV